MATPLYGSENFSTTLNVGGGINNSQTTGIVLTSVSGLATNGGILGIDWASTIDTSTYEEIEYGGITGNELTGVTRGANGTSAKAHNNGAVIAAVISKSHNDRLADKLTGRDATAIQDPNANEILKTDYVASAVNEITVKNAATGNAPQFAATGGDTNIDLNLVSKGSGVVKINGTAYAAGTTDGWISSSDTLLYASATSITISGVDRTAIFQKGTLVKFTNNSVTYYGTVASSSFSTNTTVNFIANADFSIANSAITAPYYSYAANPQGFPNAFTCSTTTTANGGGTFTPGFRVQKFTTNGRRCRVFWETNAHTVSGTVTSIDFSLPVTDSFESSSGFYMGLAGFSLTSTQTIWAQSVDGTKIRMLPTSGNWAAVAANGFMGLSYDYQF